VSGLQPGDLDLLRRWLAREVGLRGTDYRDEFLARRVLPRMEASKSATLGAYLTLLEQRSDEKKGLIQRFLIPTTEFFRNPEVFESLGEELARLRAPRGLNLLSAPCSTGEEAVSLSLVLDSLGLRGRIVAADLSAPALARLREGRWPVRTLEKLDRSLVARYFGVEDGWAVPAPRLMQRILPVRWDLGRGMPGRGFHAVLLRNLFIYLTAQAQERMTAEAGQALLPGGLLVLGRVERLVSREGWEEADRDGRLYRWKGERR